MIGLIMTFENPTDSIIINIRDFVPNLNLIKYPYPARAMGSIYK